MALVGHKAIIHSQTCDISLTEAFHPAQLFSTAVTCTGKQPLIITNNESIIPSFDTFNTSSHFNFTTHDGAESIVFDYPHNPTNITVLPHAGYLPLLASATEIGWATFAECYLEPACYTLLMKILLPLLLWIWRVVTPAKVYHERILPFILGARRFIIAIKVHLERAYYWCALLIIAIKVYLERAYYWCALLIIAIKVYLERAYYWCALLIIAIKVYLERAYYWCALLIIAIKVYLERAYYWCALLIEVLLPFLLAAWRLITAPKPDKSPPPEANILPIPSLPNEETTQLRLTTKSQATEIEQLKAQIATDKANKQKKIDDGVSTRVKHWEQRVKSWGDVLAKEKVGAGRSMERQKNYHDEELADVKERFEADSKLTAERNETIVADLKQRIDALQAQVDGQGTQLELNPQAKTHESVAIEGEEAKDWEGVVAVEVQKKHKAWESWFDAERTKVEEKFKDLQGQLANATERSNSEKNRADQAESQFNNAQQIVNNERKRAEDAEQLLQNAEIQLQNYQKHADEMWTAARKEAKKTLNGYKKRANNAETKLKNAQKTAEEASDRAKNAEDGLKQLQDHGTYTGTSSASPLPSAALSDPTQATGPTDTPPKPSTAPLYNPTSPPTFGGGAAGTTRTIPTTSSISTTSISDLARYFTDKYNLSGPNGTLVPTIPRLSPISTSTKPSGLPGPSNSSPPYIPGFNGPVFTLTNPTALPGTWPVPSPFNPVTRPGKGPVPNPFNPNASPFKPDAPPTHIPTVGIPDGNSSDIFLPSAPPFGDEDAMSVNGLNDLSNFSGPNASAFIPNASAFIPDAPPTHIPTVGIPDGNSSDIFLPSAPPFGNEDAMSVNGLNDLYNFSGPNASAFIPDAPPTHTPTVGIPDGNSSDISLPSAPPSKDEDAMSVNGTNDLSNFSDPNASSFIPDAPPTHTPTVGIPDGNSSDISLPSAPPSKDEDAMSDGGLNDLSKFSDPNDNKRDAVDGNKASAEVIAGRKIAKPRGRRGGASAGKRELVVRSGA
ncbi:hypothetical protein OEA41_005339 [Lepraria neglecta]|uniref:Nuclear pore complex NUP2/50/61 domain-containing protein n=1 Tax=Lepraria neglecta TaxID=209136 RepID=A0AAD9Z0W5_9LECA|nr:hypothetical protein OEA41_005339 [Lepraria neglecta]